MSATPPATAPSIAQSWSPSESFANRALRAVRFRTRRTSGDQELIELILARLAAISETAEAFARAEFVQQLFNFDDEELTWGTIQYGFTLALALLGILGTVAAALGSSEGSWKTLAIIAGALVAALTALNQAWSPGGAAATFKLGYGELRAEGWDYLNRLGAYKAFRSAADVPSPPATSGQSISSLAPSPPTTPGAAVAPANAQDLAAYDLFAERVKAITKRTGSVTQKESTPGG